MEAPGIVTLSAFHERRFDARAASSQHAPHALNADVSRKRVAMQGMKILCYEALAAGDQPGQAIALSQLQVLQAFAHSSSLIRFLHHSRGCDTCLVAMGLEDMTRNIQDFKSHSQPNADNIAIVGLNRMKLPRKDCSSPRV
jgi:hypothetical protein